MWDLAKEINEEAQSFDQIISSKEGNGTLDGSFESFGLTRASTCAMSKKPALTRETITKQRSRVKLHLDRVFTIVVSVVG